MFGWRTAAFYPPAVFFVDSQKLKYYAETNFDFEYANSSTSTRTSA